MTLVEILTGIGEDAARPFNRPKMPPIRLGNGYSPGDDEYDRTPFWAFELASGKNEGERVFLSMDSFEADDWQLCG